MKNLFLTILLIIFTIGIQAQDQDSIQTSDFGFDFYGSIVPLPLGGIHIFHHLHVGFSFKELKGLGLTASLWGSGNAYSNNEDTGIGVQFRPIYGKVLLKLEAGILGHFSKIDDDFKVRRVKNTTIPYIRTHLGFRIKEILIAGFNINYIPATENLIFHNNHTDIDYRPADLETGANMHRGVTLFFGVSLF